MKNNEVKVIVMPNNYMLLKLNGGPIPSDSKQLEDYYQIVDDLKDCFSKAEEHREIDKTIYAFTSVISEESNQPLVNDIMIEFQGNSTLESIYGKEFRDLVHYVNQNTNKNKHETGLSDLKKKISEKIHHMKEKMDENKETVKKVIIGTGVAVGVVAIAAGAVSILSNDTGLSSDNQYNGQKTKTSIADLLDPYADPADYSHYAESLSDDSRVLTEEEKKEFKEAMEEYDRAEHGAIKDLVPTENIQSEISGKGK